MSDCKGSDTIEALHKAGVNDEHQIQETVISTWSKNIVKSSNYDNVGIRCLCNI